MKFTLQHAGSALSSGQNKSRTNHRPAGKKETGSLNLLIDLLHCDGDGRRFTGGAAVSNPVTCPWIPHHFVSGTVRLGVDFAADDSFRRRNCIRAVHEVDGNRSYGLRLVVV